MLTNAQAIEKLYKEASTKYAEELKKKKPDEAVLATYIATIRHAQSLMNLPSNEEYKDNGSAEKIARQAKLILDSGLAKDPELFYAQCIDADYKEMTTGRYFFEKYSNDQTRLILNKDKRSDLSTDRNALHMLATAQMMGQGYSIKDILNPYILKKEKLEAGESVMKMYNNASDEELNYYCATNIFASLKETMKYINDEISKLPKITGEELLKPENQHIVHSLAYLQDLGQELGHPKIKAAAIDLFGEEEYKELINKQTGGSVVLKTIVYGRRMAFNLLQGKEKFPNRNLQSESDRSDIAQNLFSKVSNFIEGKATEKLVKENYSGKDRDFFNIFRNDVAKGEPNPFIKEINDYKNSLMNDYITEGSSIEKIGNYLAKNPLQHQKIIGKGLIEGTFINPNDISITSEKKVVINNLEKSVLNLTEIKLTAKNNPEKKEKTAEEIKGEELKSRKSYCDEIERLAKELAKSGKDAADDTKSYKEFKAYLSESVNALKNASSTEFFNTLKERLEGIQQKAQHYKEERIEANKLSSTQIQRIKTMNRLECLKMGLDRNVAYPDQMLADKLGEKVMQASLIEGINGKNPGPYIKDFLNAAKIYEAGRDFVAANPFIEKNGKGVSRSAVEKMLKQNGPKMLKEVSGMLGKKPNQILAISTAFAKAPYQKNDKIEAVTKEAVKNVL